MIPFHRGVTDHRDLKGYSGSRTFLALDLQSGLFPIVFFQAFADVKETQAAKGGEVVLDILGHSYAVIFYYKADPIFVSSDRQKDLPFLIKGFDSVEQGVFQKRL